MTDEQAPGATGDARDRRPAVALIVGVAAAIAAVVLTMIVLRPSPTPSLAVFEREPTQQEREAEQRIAERDADSFFASTDVRARLILDLPDGSASRAREIWALRSDERGTLDRPFIVICLATDPIGATGGQLGCMAERDVARRGFIPLDQPRPTLRVDGELRVIEWGPTGDARLIEPPEPPTFPRRTEFES